MRSEIDKKVFAVTAVVFLPLAAGLLTHVITNNPDLSSAAFYGTSLGDALVFGFVAYKANQRRLRQ